MQIKVLKNARTLGAAAGKKAAELIEQTISEKGTANIILATGTSQFETLLELIQDKTINWDKVTIFHLDEYIDLPEDHPASFRKYLKERVLAYINKPSATYFINGENDPQQECRIIGKTILNHPIDVALLGIGENGHLAFNDPPADFDTEDPYIIVRLDDECIAQQFNEGWFLKIEDVPKQAISMSIKHIMKSKAIICSVPDARKAKAVKDCLEGDVSNMRPGSVLQQHDNCLIYLDEASASLLEMK